MMSVRSSLWRGNTREPLYRCIRTYVAQAQGTNHGMDTAIGTGIAVKATATMAATRQSDATVCPVTSMPSFSASTQSNGLIVATTGLPSPAISLSWVLPAGSRYEDASTSGMSHFLRHALFMGNSKESSLAIARKTELRGAQISIVCTQDAIILSCDCAHEELEGVLECIGNMIQHFKLEHYQVKAVKERVDFDRQVANSDPSSRLWSSAFEAAFRNGLGNALIAVEGRNAPTPAALQAYLQEALARSGNIIAATGLEHLELTETLKRSPFSHKVATTRNTRSMPKYYGGERRMAGGDEEKNHVLIAFGTRGLVDTAEDAAVRVLAALIGANDPVKYGDRLSALPAVQTLLAKWPTLSLKTSVQQCTDGGLLGMHLCGPAGTDLKPAIEALCKELRMLLSDAPIPTETIVRGKTHAATALLQGLERRQDRAIHLALQLLARPLEAGEQAADLLQKMDHLATTEIKSAAMRIFMQRPTMVVLGNLQEIPYMDSLDF